MEDADDATASIAAGIRALVGPLPASHPQRAHEDGQGAPARPAVVVSARPRHSQRTPGKGTGLSRALAHARPLRYRGCARLPRVVESSQHPLLRPTWLRRARADPVRRPGSGAHADVARPSLTSGGRRAEALEQQPSSTATSQPHRTPVLARSGPTLGVLLCAPEDFGTGLNSAEGRWFESGLFHDDREPFSISGVLGLRQTRRASLSTSLTRW